MRTALIIIFAFGFGLALAGGTWLLLRFSKSEGRAISAVPVEAERLVPRTREPSSRPDDDVCPRWEFEAIPGIELSAELQEMSGLAFSQTWEDLVYHINDSGNDPDLLLTDQKGQNLRKIPFSERSSDPEDLAVASCPWGGHCLFIADTGDNFRLRSQRQIWGLDETTLFGPSVRRFRIDLLYPRNQRFDVEALAVSPDGREFSFFTKEKGRSQVLLGRWDGFSPTMELMEGPLLEKSMVTGATMHPSGQRILLLNLYGILELSQTEQEGFQRQDRDWFPYERRMSLPYLAQQEAIAYTLDGQGLLYTSERKPWSRTPWGWMWGHCR